MSHGEDRDQNNADSYERASLAIMVILIFVFAVATYLLLARILSVVAGGSPPPRAGPPLSASARLLRGAVVGNGTAQSLAFSINVTSHYNATLRLVEVVVDATTVNNLSTSVILTPGSPSNATVVSASLVNLTQMALAPGGSQVLYVNVTAPVGDPVMSVGFKLVFIAPNGRVVVVFTNTASVATVVSYGRL